MMTLNKTVTLISLVILKKIINPIKIGMVILIAGAIILILVASDTGNVWTSSIIFLLYLGGILVVFIVISSVAPNEKPKKVKRLLVITFLLASIFLRISNKETLESLVSQSKARVSSGALILAIILLMSSYFFIFLSVVREGKTSIRTFD